MLHAHDLEPDRRPDTARLEQAFDTFARASAALEGTYRALEERVARLTEELAEANDEQVRQAEENTRLCTRLAELIEALPAGVVVVGADDRVEQANATALGMLGGRGPGLDWTTLARAAFALREGEEAVLRDGRRLTLTERELPAGSGRVVLLADDGDARAVRALLERHRRLSTVGEMAARIAHQVRTPLSAALLYASQLDDERLEPGERRRLVARAVSRLRDLDRTVQEMLAHARGSEPSAERIRLGDVVDTALESVQPELGPGISVAVDCPDREATATGSRTALAGALANLVANAAQAVGDTGRIELRACATAGGGITFDVEDDGPGIPADALESVFEPFRTTRPGGTGLGLAIVRSVAEAHGGTARASASPLGGARVTLTIPARRAGVEGAG
ncbi:MAG: ATP-binding protein [Steroidobacteraceae bacterium]